jgi:hypothetical protein
LFAPRANARTVLALSDRDEGLLVECGDDIVEFVVGPRVVGAIFAEFAVVN